MKRRVWMWIALLLFLLFAPAFFAEQLPNAGAKIREVEQGLGPLVRLNNGPLWTIEERMKDLGVPGLGIAVVHNFQVEWAKGYGVRNAQTGEPVTEATRFQWASVTKPVTAVVVLRLVQDGVLDLDRNVNDYLKSWKVPENEFTRAEKVTLRRLLSHDAGMTVSGFQGYSHNEPLPTILQVLDGAAPAKNAPIRVDKKPGTGFRYSGGGYTVVQLLIEDVTGLPMSRVARDLLFTPAGMTTASIGTPSTDAEQRQISMAHVQKGVAEPGYRFQVGGSSCCELWATPADLARFVIALQRSFRGDKDAVLSKAMARAMLTPASSSSMGLGIEVERTEGGIYFSHSGGNPGFSTWIVANAESGDGVVVAANTGVGQLPGEIQSSVAKAYSWPGASITSFASAEDLDRQMHAVLAGTAVDSAERRTLTEGNLNRLGYALLRAHRVSEAVAVLRTTADVFPQSAGASESLAEVYEAASDLKGALGQYRQALVRLEKFPEANTGYERNRAATVEKIRRLEGRMKD